MVHVGLHLAPSFIVRRNIAVTVQLYLHDFFATPGERL
jgi:hypothetical protein